MEKMLAQGYRGSRYSFGYPACPRLEDQAPILRMLGAERIGMSLSDEFQLHPEQSTSADRRAQSAGKIFFRVRVNRATAGIAAPAQDGTRRCNHAAALPTEPNDANA